MEYITGEKIATRIDPDTGNDQFDIDHATRLANLVTSGLLMQFPYLSEESIPPINFDQSRDLNQQMKDWLKPLEDKYGAYLEVEQLVMPHIAAHRKRSQTGDGLPPFSSN